MTTDLQIEQVKNKLIDTVNSCDLPVGVVLYIVNDISRQLKEIYDYNINKELNASNTPPLTEDAGKKKGDEE